MMTARELRDMSSRLDWLEADIAYLTGWEPPAQPAAQPQGSQPSEFVRAAQARYRAEAHLWSRIYDIEAALAQVA